MIVSFALLGVLGAAPGAPLADIFVDAAANCAAGAGTSAAPYCTIDAAIAVAVNGDVIRIAAGTYVENLTLAANIDLVGTDGQALTVIDGGLTGTVVTVVAGSSVTLDGLTIQRGAVAGIDVEGTLALRNSTVTDNGNGIDYGGIVQMYPTGPLTIVNSTISNNNGGFGGGGIYSYGGDVTITDSTISGNMSATGAAMYTTGGSVTLRGSTVVNNASSFYGVVYSFDSDLTVENSTISGNMGGGIDIGPATCILRNTTVFANDGLNSGTGVYAFSSAGITQMINTVVAGTINGAGVSDLDGDFISNGSNFIGIVDPAAVTGFTNGNTNDQVGSPAAPLDPLLGLLLDNGGPTLTHQPLAGSPLIDAGDQITFEPFDQRGIARVAGSVDIGSTEDSSVNPQGCMSNANSTGSIGMLSASGSVAVADDDFTLSASGLPLNQFGIFLVAPIAGFMANPGGSAGNLCLDGTIGRFFLPSQITSSGPTGVLSLQIPLTMLPQGNGFIAAQPGDTWFFQAWHRDVVSAMATSNFSTAIGVTFN